MFKDLSMMSAGTGAWAITCRSMVEAQAYLVLFHQVGHPRHALPEKGDTNGRPIGGRTQLIGKYNQAYWHYIFTARLRTFFRRHMGELALCLIIFSIVAVAWMLLLMQDPNWQYVHP